MRRSGKPKWSAGKKVVVALLGLIVLLAAIAGGGYAYLWYRYDQINKVHISAEEAVQNGGPFTILVIGSDSRVGITGQGVQAFGSSSVVTGQRSDVLQLWRVTPATKQIQIVSVPRDTVVSMLPPDSSQYGTYNRINAAYNTGANQLVKTITANLGVPINHVVQVDFAGFQNAVNALGGIYLDFPYPAKDAYSGLNITTPGCQLVGGFQALAVARARHYQYYTNGYWHYDGTSDFGRIQRQDVFIKSMMSAAKSKVNPLTVNAFLGSVNQGIQIDDGFGFNELIGLALTYHSFDPTALGRADPAHGLGQRVRQPGRRADRGPAGGPADARRTSSARASWRPATRRPMPRATPTLPLRSRRHGAPGDPGQPDHGGAVADEHRTGHGAPVLRPDALQPGLATLGRRCRRSPPTRAQTVRHNGATPQPDELPGDMGAIE